MTSVNWHRCRTALTKVFCTILCHRQGGLYASYAGGNVAVGTAHTSALPQLCLTVLKDILRGTENVHDFTGGQQTAHFLSDQELYIKEKAAIIRTVSSLALVLYSHRAEKRDQGERGLNIMQYITNVSIKGKINFKVKYIFLYCTYCADLKSVLKMVAILSSHCISKYYNLYP